MKVLLVIWTDPAWHPSLVNTSQIFSELGSSVHILGRTPNPGVAVPGPVEFGANVRLRLVGQGQKGWRDKLDYLRFLRRALILARRWKPDVIIGYDLFGFVAAAFAGSSLGHAGAKLIYHNFDLAPRQDLNVFARSLKSFELAGARRADGVIVSSAGRAEIFKQEAGLLRSPTVVMNCQRLRVSQQKTGELDQILADKGLSFDRLVVRLGMLAPGNAVEATIRSVAEWEGNWGLVLAGVSYESFLDEMQKLVRSLGLDKKVVFLPTVPYSLWYDCLYSADLGIALYEPGNVNNKNMAGAGNKLNLYLKAGIPSILPDLPDFVTFVEQFRAGELAEPNDPHSIAKAVNVVLTDPDRYETYSQGARRAFQTEFNFEKQFEPILCEIAKVC